MLRAYVHVEIKNNADCAKRLERTLFTTFDRSPDTMLPTTARFTTATEPSSITIKSNDTAYAFRVDLVQGFRS